MKRSTKVTFVPAAGPPGAQTSTASAVPSIANVSDEHAGAAAPARAGVAMQANAKAKTRAAVFTLA